MFSVYKVGNSTETKKDPSEELLESLSVVEKHSAVFGEDFLLEGFHSHASLTQLPTQGGQSTFNLPALIHAFIPQTKNSSLKSRWHSLVNAYRMILR